MKLRVLLVDDERIVRRGLRELLPWEKHGMEVAGEATTGEDALNWLRTNAADVVFVDLNMPVMDGFELLHRLNQEYPSLIRVVLTCDAEVKHIQRTIEEGIAGYILKTDFDNEEIEKLFVRIQKLFDRQQDLVYALLLGVTRERYRQCQAMPVEAHWIGEDQALLRGHGNQLSALPIDGACAMITLREEDAKRLAREPKLAQALTDRLLGYEATDTARVFAMHDLPELSEKTARMIEEKLWEGKWLLSKQAFGRLTNQMEACRYPVSAAVDVLARLMESLGWLAEDAALRRSWAALSAARYPLWREVSEVMRQMGERVTAHVLKSGVSDSSAEAVLHALRLLQEPQKLFCSVDDIASQLGFSRSHFSRNFSKMMDASYKDYVRTLRLRTIRQMHRDEGLSIEDIAARVGYANVEYFVRLYSDKMAEEP